MTLLKLTPEIIQADIERYQERISVTQNKLARLPAGYLPYPEYKKCEAVRRELEGEILHVEKLIEFAKEALITL